MAFNIANIDRLAEALDGISWFDYRTTDTFATVEGANYFANYAKFLDVYDKILVRSSDNLIWYVVTAVTVPVNIQGYTSSSTAAASVTIARETINTAILTSDFYTASTWTPVFTFATPGDLAVVYSNQVGTYIRIGNLVWATFQITMTTFTHTTAVGNAQITGLPLTSANNGVISYGPVGQWTGVTKAGYTQMAAQLAAAATTFNFNMSGSALAASSVTTADMPTGGTPTLRGNLTYQTS